MKLKNDILSNTTVAQTQKLRLMEPETEELTVPDVTISYVINLPSNDFPKIIQELSLKSVTSDKNYYCWEIVNIFK